MKKAFTIIELIFVIVILGILAGVAIPKLFVTRDDAMIAKIRTDVAAIRSGIELLKSQKLLSGDVTPPDLGNNFSSVISGGIKPTKGKSGWINVPTNGGKSDNTITYEVCIRNGECANYTYNTSSYFECSGKICDKLE